jgi:hypothetical protein
MDSQIDSNIRLDSQIDGEIRMDSQININKIRIQIQIKTIVQLDIFIYLHKDKSIIKSILS